MAQHKPDMIWELHPPNKYPNGEICTISTSDIMIASYPCKGVSVEPIILSRRDARLLAKRINQCLDATK